METSDILRLFIRDCRVDLMIGLHEEERRKPQPVIVNVECESCLTHRYDDLAEESLDRVIDYAPFYRFIRDELPLMGPICLLESAAEKIASFFLRDERVQKVRVRIEKTSIFPHAAGVGIELVRIKS